MLSIEIEYLMGRAVATQVGARDAAEWPPHPQRLFSALVATHSDFDSNAAGDAALRWLETLAPPDLRVDLEPEFRNVRSHFVPVNDESVKIDVDTKKGEADFRHPLDQRNRQERFFPAIVPKEPTVVFQWSDTPGIDVHRKAIGELVENLVYLGHSSSPIRACLRDEAVEPNLVPTPDGQYRLRVPGPGRLARLNDVHRLRLKDATTQPPLGRVESYERAEQTISPLFASKALRLAFKSGPRLGIDSTIPLLQHFRDAILARLKTATPPSLSGHDADGRPTSDHHLALAPLAFVNSRHADGSLKGIALIPPRNLHPQVLRRLRAAVEGSWSLHLGVLGSIAVELSDESDTGLKSLSFDAYTKQSLIWATVTPIALDRHPKKKGPTAETIVAQSCVKIGLPEPIEVRLGSVSAIAGAPRARDFHGRCKQTEGRVVQHAVLRFELPVAGPIILGAGRFLGLGLCVPFAKAGQQ